MPSLPISPGSTANHSPVAARVRSWNAPGIGSVPTKYGFPPSKVRREWEALGELPPLPPADGVVLNLDLDSLLLSVDLYHYQVFPTAMEGLYNLSADDRAPILEWFDSSSPVAGPEGVRYLAELYWCGCDDEKEFCKWEGIPLDQYNGPTLEDVNQRMREMRGYEKGETRPVPGKVNTLINTTTKRAKGSKEFGSPTDIVCAKGFYPGTFQTIMPVPWAILADVGSLDEQLLQRSHPDIGHNPVVEYDLPGLEELHHAAEEFILSFTKSLELLTELQKLA